MPKSLVLVVGAGASKEVNLPVGSELKSKIASALNIQYEDGYRRSSGDAAIDSALREIARSIDPHRADINPYLHAPWRIRDAMPQAISIDNFIDSHRGDDRIAICGKLAIARCILVAESDSSLFVNRQTANPKIDFAQIDSTWYNNFFQLLTESCQEHEIERRFARIAIVTFNYDRCIEHYLHGALQNYFGVSSERASEAMTHLRIFHPYGSVGSLPWQGLRGAVDYGATVGGQMLRAASERIRTFAEGIDPETSEVSAIRQTLHEAERVAFLGFAFQRLNLSLLFPGLPDGAKVVNRPTFATGVGISNADRQEIATELSKIGAVFPERFFFRSDLTCADLFKEFGRSLRLS